MSLVANASNSVSSIRMMSSSLLLTMRPVFVSHRTGTVTRPV
jgi:hypothetical protein